MFPHWRGQATFVAEASFAFRKHFASVQMFPRLHAKEAILENTVSATMFLRVQGPLRQGKR